mgnify:CR=1 FL=1
MSFSETIDHRKIVWEIPEIEQLKEDRRETSLIFGEDVEKL